MIKKFIKQMSEWAGDFGKEYTDRNYMSLEEMDLLYKSKHGITRTEMNSKFIGDLNRNIMILEVGSNIGNQLLCLQNMGFMNLYGVELQSYAVALSKGRTKNINVIQGNAFDVPFKDSFFDLVFTAGVLIHIAPADISKAIDEIYRCTRQYIWCSEYYSDFYTQVHYRGHEDMLWKTNFSGLFLKRFRNLRLVKEEHIKYLNNDNIDTMFLLEKMTENIT